MDSIAQRKLEFSPQGYIFDLPHVLAEKAAEFILLYLQSLASKQGISNYLLINSDSNIHVALTDNPLAFSYRLDKQDIPYIEALTIIATDTLISGEERVS